MARNRLVAVAVWDLGNASMVGQVKDIELWSSALANLATIVALIVGGYWTWRRFFRQRTEKPRATLSYRASHRPLTDQDDLLWVSVRAENTGSVLLKVRELRCEVQQVVPLASETVEKLEARELINERNEADLECIRCYEPTWEPGQVEIEPGESDIFDFDFVVSKPVETILIYAHLPNAERDDGIGWDTSGFFDLHTSPNPQTDQQSGDKEKP